nr:ribonuclease H-like domain, reverse transcriptase, RNA-dependent DNA polymerase [Tanacetum cinerariifolium]
MGKFKETLADGTQGPELNRVFKDLTPEEKNRYKDDVHYFKMEPRKVSQAFDDESWVEAMQEELLQFSLQKVWRLVNLPYGKNAIGTKWVYRFKKDERGIVVMNKARLVAQGHRQEEGIDYDEVFALVARIEAIRIFLAFASFIGFIVYQMDVKKGRYNKYVAEILKKFDFSSIKIASTPIETQKPLVKDELAADVDVYLYRSMIGSSMYLTTSRPNIMFTVCACSRDSLFDLESYSDSDYARANLDRKSTTRGCQFLSRRLISWQCKKQTIVATSTTEAEYAKLYAAGQKVSTAEPKVSAVEPKLVLLVTVTLLFDSMLVQNQAPEGEGSAIPTEPQLTPSTSQPNISATQIAPLQTATHPTVSHEPQTKTHIKQILPSSSTYQRKHKKTHKPKKAKKVTKLPQTSVPLDIRAYEVVHQEGGDSVERAITTNAPRKHIGGADAQTRFETASKRSSDPPLSTSHTVRSREDMMEQETNLTDFVPPTPYDLPLPEGHTPGSDEDLVIKRFQKKMKRLENKQRTRTPGMKLSKIGTSNKKTLDKENVSKQWRDESNRTEEINLFDKGSGETKVFDYTTAAEKDAAEPVSTADDAVNAASVIPDVSAAGPSTSTAKDIFENDMKTMADTLIAIRRTRPRTTSVVIHDVEEEPRRATPPPIVQIQDKEDVQERIDADALLAKRLQQEEREQFTVDEQARMLVDLIAERKRFFAAQRAKQIRNKPLIKAQLRNKMVTYLKHMGKYTHNQLKSKSFKEFQMLYEREQKWINDFVPMDSKEVNDSEQQAEDLGSLNYFLGIYVTRDSLGMFLSQRKYATKILEQAHMVGGNSNRNPVDAESKLGDDGDPVSDPTLYQSLTVLFSILLLLALIFLMQAPGWLPYYSGIDFSTKAEYRDVANAVAKTC